MSPSIGGIRPWDSLRSLTRASIASSRRRVGGTSGRPSDSSASIRICWAASKLVLSSTSGQLHQSIILANLSFWNSDRRHRRVAERRDERGMLAGSARHRDMDIIGRGRDREPVAVGLVAGAYVGLLVLLGDP